MKFMGDGEVRIGLLYQNVVVHSQPSFTKYHAVSTSASFVSSTYLRLQDEESFSSRTYLNQGIPSSYCSRSNAMRVSERLGLHSQSHIGSRTQLVGEFSSAAMYWKSSQ